MTDTSRAVETLVYLRQRAAAVDPATAPDDLARAVLGSPDAPGEELARQLLAVFASVQRALPRAQHSARKTAARLCTAAKDATPTAGLLLHQVLGVDRAASSGDVLATLARTATELIDALTLARPSRTVRALVREFDAHDRAALAASGLRPEQYAAALARAGHLPDYDGAVMAQPLSRLARATLGTEETAQGLRALGVRLRRRADALEAMADSPDSPWCVACRHLRDAAETVLWDAVVRSRRQVAADPATGLPAADSRLGAVSLRRAADWVGGSPAGYVRLGSMSGTTFPDLQRRDVARTGSAELRTWNGGLR